MNVLFTCMQACMYGHVSVLQQLLDAELQLKDCASANRKDASGQAALHYAAQWGYPEVGFCYMTEKLLCQQLLTVQLILSTCG